MYKFIASIYTCGVELFNIKHIPILSTTEGIRCNRHIIRNKTNKPLPLPLQFLSLELFIDTRTRAIPSAPKPSLIVHFCLALMLSLSEGAHVAHLINADGFLAARKALALVSGSDLRKVCNMILINTKI